MTSEQVAAAWSASGNGLTASEAESLTVAFVAETQSRRRRSSLGLAAVGIAFAALSTLTVAVLRSQADLDAANYATFGAINVLTWGGWLIALAAHLARDRTPSAAGLPVRDALRRALQQRRTHLGHLRLIAGGMLLSTPLVALSVEQMLEAGRLKPEDLPLAIVGAIGAYSVAAACLGADYFGPSSREVERLQSLVADCDRDATRE